MSNKIILNTGLQTFEIEFADRGVTTEISFNPSDPDLALRFSMFKDRVDEQMKGMKDIELNADGTPKDLSFVENIKEINRIIYSELDAAFGYPISETVFQFCNPMATTNGKYFVVQFMEAITPVIRENVMNEKKKLDKHLNKYVNKK